MGLDSIFESETPYPRQTLLVVPLLKIPNISILGTFVLGPLNFKGPRANVPLFI